MGVISMAPKHLLLLVLWDLSFFLHGVVSSCNVTCSTDYSVSLNCSCADAAHAQSVFLYVICRDGDVEVNGSCEVKPPGSWCVMSPLMFDEVLSVSTECVARASDAGGAAVDGGQSSHWDLCNVVKPQPPAGLQVTNAQDVYNLTWDHVNQEDCLTYVVRIRDASEWSKEPVYSLSSDSKRLRLSRERLQPAVRYLVDVKAQLCPDKVYFGPWSEWSPTVEIGPTAAAGIAPPSLATAMHWHLFYITPSVLTLVVLVCLLFAYLMKNHQIPKPDHFFAPLYHNYGGNFKEWVNPVFKECDYFMVSSQVHMKSEHDVLQWNSEKQSCTESNQAKKHGNSLHKLQAHDSSLLLCQDGGSQRSDCVGHISIHTVTLSEEEECEEERMSQNSACVLGSDQDRESFELFVEDMKDQAAFGLEEDERGFLPALQRRASRDSSEGNHDVALRIQLFGAERASLDSLALNEPSEDGYPHVDLDTIDSGFGEYNSPAASPGTEQTQSLHEHINLHSNYVKQWMVCKTAEEA